MARSKQQGKGVPAYAVAIVAVIAIGAVLWLNPSLLDAFKPNPISCESGYHLSNGQCIIDTIPPPTTTADYTITASGTTYTSRNAAGAIFTSGTDAKTVIQNTIDAGGTISVAAGTYFMSGSVMVTGDGISLIGAGDSTIFKPTVKTNLFLVENGASDIELGNFQIEGLKAPEHYGTYAVRLRGAVHDINVHHLYIHDYDGYGVIAGDSPFTTSGIPTDITLAHLRLYDNDEVALGLAGRNILATDIKTRTLSPEVSSIAIEVDFPHYVMDNITLDGFTAEGGKRGVLVADYQGAAIKKDITIKNGTISKSLLHGLDMNQGVWQNVKVDNVTINNSPVGLFDHIAGVQYSNMHYSSNGVNIG